MIRSKCCALSADIYDSVHGMHIHMYVSYYNARNPMGARYNFRKTKCAEKNNHY